MRTIRVLGFFAAIVVLASIAAGAFYNDPGTNSVASWIGYAIILLSASSILFFRKRTSQISLLHVSWVAIAVTAGVQLNGGYYGSAVIIYPLLLTWIAIPSVNGSSAITGFIVGVLEVVSLILRSGSGFEIFAADPVPLIKIPVILSGFGALVEWLLEKEFSVPGSGSTEQQSSPAEQFNQSTISTSGGSEISRNFLPLLHRLSESLTSCLLVRREDSSFELSDFIGGQNRLTGKKETVSRDDTFLFPAISSGEIIRIPVQAGKEKLIPWYSDPPPIKSILVCPVRSGSDNKEVYVFESVMENAFGNIAVERICEVIASIEATAKLIEKESGIHNDTGTVFCYLLRNIAHISDIDQALHIVVSALHESLFSGATVTVVFLSGDGVHLKVYETMGKLGERRKGKSFRKDTGIVGWVIDHGMSIHRNRMRSGDLALRTFSEEDDPQRRTGCLIVCPLKIKNRTVGAVTLERENNDGFSSSDETLLSGTASLLGLTLEHVSVQDRRDPVKNRDCLTGLPDISGFFKSLKDAVKDIRRYGKSVSILIADIDGFKELNRKFSYRTADEILVQVSKRLYSLLGNSDGIARHGSDSFAICLKGADLAEAEAMAERIIMNISQQTFTICENTNLNLTVCVGGYTTHTEGRGVELLMEEAENSLELARNSGVGRCRIREYSHISPRKISREKQ